MSDACVFIVHRGVVVFVFFFPVFILLVYSTRLPPLTWRSMELEGAAVVAIRGIMTLPFGLPGRIVTVCWKLSCNVFCIAHNTRLGNHSTLRCLCVMAHRFYGLRVGYLWFKSIDETNGSFLGPKNAKNQRIKSLVTQTRPAIHALLKHFVDFGFSPSCFTLVGFGQVRVFTW